jgi:magnesium-transporting ATPase (P-type)
MKRAAVAALLTAVASYPRLTLWSERSYPLGFMLVLLFLISFVMWAFVFAWIPEHGGVNLFPRRLEGRVWAWATLAGLAGAALLRSVFDPSLRRLLPQDYPATTIDWLATTLFHLAFVQLFLSFAPLAFFARLFGERYIAAALTVLFGLFLLSVQVNAAKVGIPGWLAAHGRVPDPGRLGGDAPPVPRWTASGLVVVTAHSVAAPSRTGQR